MTVDATLAVCPLCDGQNANREKALRLDEGSDYVYTVSCNTCGTYDLSYEAIRRIEREYEGQRFVISGVARELSDRGGRLSILKGTDIAALIANAPVPKNALEYADRLLLYVAERSKMHGHEVVLGENDYPRLYAQDRRELVGIVRFDEERRCLNVESGGDKYEYRRVVALTLAGWERVRELRAERPISDNAFVAMWFPDREKDPQDWEMMNAAFVSGFQPALETCGYKAIKINDVPNAEDIVQRILGEIRRSGLVVADYTGQRGGVYYEAGFAYGLGRNVIHTCKKDHMGNLHFDIRNRNTIDWVDTEDLRMRLANLIRGLGWDRKKPQTA